MDIDRVLTHRDQLSHAYFIEGGENARMALLLRLAQLGIETERHPDVEVRTFEQFGIDESRELRERSARKPLMADRNYFILTCGVITPEAQNALLKTFEDPVGNPVFFVIGERRDMLLPTLQSRMIVIEGMRGGAGSVIDIPAFLKATPAVRIKMLEPLIESRDPQTLGSFLDELESRIAQNGQEPAMRAGLQSVYRARRYLKDKGALVKILLEHIALLVPAHA